MAFDLLEPMGTAVRSELHNHMQNDNLTTEINSAAVPSEASTGMLAASALSLAHPRDEGRQILLVEDEAFVRKAAAEVLETAGYRVLVARNAVEAVEICHRSSGSVGPVDLLLTDVVLPGRNGRELAHELSVSWPGIRVLLISGYAGLSSESSSGYQYLAKPFSTQILLSKVRQVLEGCEAVSPSRQASLR